MKTRLIRKINLAAGRYLPEQRLYLRTDSSTRFMRLTPFTQAFFIGTAALFFGWTIFASSAYLVSALSANSANDQARLQKIDYEMRLNKISGERNKRALEAQKAQERFYVALKQISGQQTSLLASEDRRRELETGIDVIQRTLRKVMKSRDRAQLQSDKLLAELQSVTGSSSTQAGLAEEVELTLDYVNSALDKTVAERDTMEVTTEKMVQRVAKLKLKAKLTRERNQRIFSRLEDAVSVSMTPLQKMFERVGLSTDKLLKDVRAGYSGIGGPLMPISVSTMGQPQDASSLQANKLLDELDQLNMLRIAAERTPFLLPLRTSYRLSSPFGMRRHPVTKKISMHPALDMAAPLGTPVYTTADGVVVFAGWAGGYGKVIKIRHPEGFETRYAHLSKIRVKKGQRVSQGDRIGDMGSTGRSTGSHVHYEVRIGGKPVNPSKFIKAARNVF
ncbi:MAG: peptidoglycan DD-metalloendopeptidase family protein [Alphaproteobacteria bacterium]|nr:peptidoglycan DD-metalloendopeptidase family protein [Alphaproteobacteria bacterium]